MFPSSYFSVQWVEVHLILFCLHHTSNPPPPPFAALLEKTRFSTFQNDYEPSSQLAITEMGYLDLVLCIICKMFCLFRIIRREFTISQIFLWTKQFAVFWLDWCPIKGQSIEHNKGNYCSFGTKILFCLFYRKLTTLFPPSQYRVQKELGIGCPAALERWDLQLWILLEERYCKIRGVHLLRIFLLQRWL